MVKLPKISPSKQPRKVANLERIYVIVREHGHQQALNRLKPLLIMLGGRVNLKEPDVKIYLMDGLVVPSSAMLSSSTSTPLATNDSTSTNIPQRVLTRCVAVGNQKVSPVEELVVL